MPHPTIDTADPLASFFLGQDCFAEHCLSYWSHIGAVLRARRSAAFLLGCARKNRGAVHLLPRDIAGAEMLAKRGRGRIERDNRGGYGGHTFFVANRFDARMAA